MLGLLTHPTSRSRARSRQPELYLWKRQLASHFPGLSPAFVALLALWSLGIVLARRCGLSSVVGQLAPRLGQSDHTARQRLREFYQDKAAKKEPGRKDFDPEGCFAPLLAWTLSYWPCRRLALALDVTNLGDRFHVLRASVVYGGSAIPVAWKVLPGGQKDPWHPHWCRLLSLPRCPLDDSWTVVGLTDRGLESARLVQAVVGVGWHPLRRVKASGKFRPRGWKNWYTRSANCCRASGRGSRRWGWRTRTPTRRSAAPCWAAGTPGTPGRGCC